MKKAKTSHIWSRRNQILNWNNNISFCFSWKNISVKSNMAEKDIPLILSKSAIKQAKIKLDLLNDIAEIFGNTVELNNTSSDHYCLPLKEKND